MTRAEDVSHQFVAEKLKLKASWSAIARMTGASETALRRLYDPRFVPSVPPPKSPREQIRSGLVQAGFTAQEATMLSRLWHAGNASLRSVEVTRGIIGGSAAAIVARDLRRAATKRGITFDRECRKGYVLTEDGRRTLEGLAGIRSREAPQ